MKRAVRRRKAVEISKGVGARAVLEQEINLQVKRLPDRLLRALREFLKEVGKAGARRRKRNK